MIEFVKEYRVLCDKHKLEFEDKFGALRIIEQVESNASKEQKLEDAKKQYADDHDVCPKCFTKDLTITLAYFGMDEDNMDTYEDLNSVWCNCGWKGNRHGLVARKE